MKDNDAYNICANESEYEEIICDKCGHDEFQLHYFPAMYEIFGICTACGNVQSIYSG